MIFMRMIFVLALFVGEFLGIAGELWSAKGNPWFGLLIFLLGAPALIWGYYVGYKQNGIWAVTAVSIGLILIIEPALIWFLFRTIPSRNELIGCLFGVAGLIVVLFD